MSESSDFYKACVIQPVRSHKPFWTSDARIIGYIKGKEKEEEKGEHHE
jgi:hypothetical protein